jgi:predicted acetyltransferase
MMARASDDLAVDFYGLFEDERLLGGMRLHDFVMNMRSARVKAGGVGFIAVDLLHKKRGVARDLVAFFLKHCQEQGRHIALLYPFRSDFYKQMGFGYGTKMNQYRVKPGHLPKGPTREHVQLLGAGDKQLLADCYHRYLAATHGLIEKTPAEVDRLFKDLDQRIVGCVRDGRVTGYLFLTFKPVNPEFVLMNDALIEEIVYEDPEALSELLTFRHSQADQIRQLIVNTQDDALHHAFFDPRDGSGNWFSDLYQQTNLQGAGIMYRVVDLRALFTALEGVDFGGQTCTLKIEARDSFFKPNDGGLVVHFDKGRPTVRDDGDYEVAIQLDVAELSSLLMGVVSFRKLYSYGLAEISDKKYVDTVNHLFRTEEPPMCMTWF